MRHSFSGKLRSISQKDRYFLTEGRGEGGRGGRGRQGLLENVPAAAADL